jgi:hypothetical protein
MHVAELSLQQPEPTRCAQGCTCLRVALSLSALSHSLCGPVMPAQPLSPLLVTGSIDSCGHHVQSVHP